MGSTAKSQETIAIHTRYNLSTPNNVDVFGALYTLRIQYKYTQTQCEQSAKWVDIVQGTGMI